jgi:hypothetical protein
VLLPAVPYPHHHDPGPGSAGVQRHSQDQASPGRYLRAAIPDHHGPPAHGPEACAARIFDWTADLRLRQQPGHGDGWLAGCYSRSSTCWFAAYWAWPSWYSVRTWRRMLNCWCSGTRTRFCSATRPDPVRASRPGVVRRAGTAHPPRALDRNLPDYARDAAGLAPQAGGAKVRHERAAEARPSAYSPGHRPPGRSAGEGESSLCGAGDYVEPGG